jgi:hypothetical protein
MTTIDVNTGGFVGVRNFDDTIFKTNLEAAQTIARQLRLRNLGGIIIVDFIDMESEEHRGAVLAAVVGGAFLGFLPHNISPAKQFLGEAGATMAGFSLGVLALLSSAKIAIALSVLAIPIADVVFVVLGRLYRGEPWYRGDMTHLHFRLLRAGLSQQAAVWTLWLVSLFAGIAALGLQTRGKIFLVTSLVVATALASRVTSWFAHKAKDVD